MNSLGEDDAEFFNDDKNMSWAIGAVVNVKKAALAAWRPRGLVIWGCQRARGGQGSFGLARTSFMAALRAGPREGGGTRWLPESRLMSSLQTLTLYGLGKLASPLGLQGAAGAHAA